METAQTIVTYLDIAAAILGLALLLGWRPGPRRWWSDDDEPEPGRRLGHVARDAAVPGTRFN